MATWKKVVVSGSNISELNNDSAYLTTVDISADTNLAGGTNITLSGDTLNLDADISLTSVTASVQGDVVGNVTGNVTGDVTGDVTGNADTATALASGQNFSITGDGTASAISFDGSGAVALNLSLDDNVVDSAEIVDGAVDASHFSSDAATAISGAFVATSASIASDIAALESSAFDLQVNADSGAEETILNGESLDISGSTHINTRTTTNGVVITLESDLNITTVTASIQGDVVGDLTGDVTGNVTGNVTGDLTGNVTGNVTGDVTGTADTASYVAGANVDGDISGNAGTATALASAQNFSITGDGTASAISFDGSGAVALSLSLDNNVVDSAEIVDGAVDASHFSSDAATAISGAFVATSASIASDIADLEAAAYDLDIQGDSGNGTISNAQTLDIAGGDNIVTSFSGTELSIALTNDVVIAGNLTVQGTRTELNVANLNVEDQFILLNSGSTSGDSGIVFGASGDGVANAGHAIYIDNESGGGANDVFKFAKDLAHDATTGGAGVGKLGFIQSSTSVPSVAPELQGVGAIHIKTDTEDIYIYS